MFDGAKSDPDDPRFAPRPSIVGAKVWRPHDPEGSLSPAEGRVEPIQAGLHGLVDVDDAPGRGVLEVRADMAALISFYEWLTKQKSLRTALGGFARELTRDADFPRDVASLDLLLDYVRARPNSSAQTIAVARSAYRTYERSQGAALRS